MKSDPLISVIIPCFNDGQYIPETIQRLFRQSYSNFETIIVNDGSTDKRTLEILDAFRSDQQIRVLDKENEKMSAARNWGVLHAKGSIIVTLDADDYFHESFFEKALNILTSSENIIAVSSYVRFFGQENKKFKPRGGNVYNFLFSNQCPACAMIRKSDWEMIGGYDEQMKLGLEDWEFYLRLTATTNKEVYIIPEFLFNYRRTKKSTYTNFSKPNAAHLIDYLVSKNSSTYLNSIKELIASEKVLYIDARVSWQKIFFMIKDRLTRGYSK